MKSVFGIEMAVYLLRCHLQLHICQVSAVLAPANLHLDVHLHQFVLAFKPNRAYTVLFRHRLEVKVHSVVKQRLVFHRHDRFTSKKEWLTKFISHHQIQHTHPLYTLFEYQTFPNIVHVLPLKLRRLRIVPLILFRLN